MKNKTAFSKWLQVLVLLTFFLPFFPKGCEPKKTEQAAVIQQDEQANGKETAVTTEDSLKKAKAKSGRDYDVNRKAISERLSNKSKILKFLLRPNEDYTGVGYTLDMFELFYGFGAAIALLLFIIGFIIKLKDYNNIFHFINIIAVIILAFTQPALFTDTKLWGYWVCLSVGIIVVLYDSTVLFKSKKKHKK